MDGNQVQEIKRHFDVVAEGLRQEISIVAEGHEVIRREADEFRDEVKGEFKGVKLLCPDETHGAKPRTFTPSVLLFLVIFLPSFSAIAQPSLVAVCEGGSTQAIRTQYTQEKGFEVMKDRADLPMMVYTFDMPEEGSVRITSGTDETTGAVIKNHANYKTVVYIMGGVPYMDTIFFNVGVVFSTEHKELFGPQKATTYRMKCRIEK